MTSKLNGQQFELNPVDIFIRSAIAARWALFHMRNQFIATAPTIQIVHSNRIHFTINLFDRLQCETDVSCSEKYTFIHIMHVLYMMRDHVNYSTIENV